MSETSPLPSSTTNVPAKKYDGAGLVFKAKLIGTEDISVDRDEKLCLDSMFKLKAVAKARGEHKQRVQLNLTLSAVKLTDESSKTPVATHEIERISFVVIDPRDTRAFGYVYNTTDNRHQFWAIKTERTAGATVLALKELFELAFEQYTLAEKANAELLNPLAPTENIVVASAPELATSQGTTTVVQPTSTQPLLVETLLIDAPQAVVATPTPEPVVSLLNLDVAIPVITPPPPPPTLKPDDLLNDLFSDLIPMPTVNTPLTFPNSVPTPIQMNLFDSIPAAQPQVAATPVDLFATNTISPIAPPTVTNPFSGLDLLGILSGPATRPTKESFFPNQPPVKTIQQLQMEKGP